MTTIRRLTRDVVRVLESWPMTNRFRTLLLIDEVTRAR